MASLIERYRAATLDLLSRAYTTTSCAHVAACLGVSVEEAAAQGVGMGWSLGEDGMFGVVRRKVDDEAEALGMDAVEKLSAMMVHVTDIAGPGCPDGRGKSQFAADPFRRIDSPANPVVPKDMLRHGGCTMRTSSRLDATRLGVAIRLGGM